MNIKIIAVGKIKEKYFKDALEEYLKRLKGYTKIEIIEVSDEATKENATEAEENIVKEKEGERILSKISPKDYCVTLEIGGKNLDSISFSKFIEDRLPTGEDIVFVIGGSIGLSEKVLSRSNYSLSFSKMTFPHQLMRIILLEQIYRAYRILNNHPYHK